MAKLFHLKVALNTNEIEQPFRTESMPLPPIGAYDCVETASEAVSSVYAANALTPVLFIARPFKPSTRLAPPKQTRVS